MRTEKLRSRAVEVGKKLIDIAENSSGDDHVAFKAKECSQELLTLASDIEKNIKDAGLFGLMSFGGDIDEILDMTEGEEDYDLEYDNREWDK